MRKEQGFTLIELLIVVAIIAIIAAIAVPNLLEARRAANETSAQAALRNISSAQVSYAIENGGQFGKLTDLIDGGFLDERFNGSTGGAGGIISGYEIIIATSVLGLPTKMASDVFVTGEAGYLAQPVNSSSGRFCYAIGLDMVIRYALGANCNGLLPSGVTHGDPVGGKSKSTS